MREIVKRKKREEKEMYRVFQEDRNRRGGGGIALTEKGEKRRCLFNREMEMGGRGRRKPKETHDHVGVEKGGTGVALGTVSPGGGARNLVKGGKRRGIVNWCVGWRDRKVKRIAVLL